MAVGRDHQPALVDVGVRAHQQAHHVLGGWVGGGGGGCVGVARLGCPSLGTPLACPSLGTPLAYGLVSFARPK